MSKSNINNFKEWLVKSIFTRATFTSSKIKISKRTLNPLTSEYIIGVDTSLKDLYVKLPLKEGFKNIDGVTRQEIAQALITSETFKELLAPDLSELEWNWLPNHDLDVIMKYRWLKQNLSRVSLHDNWAIIHPVSYYQCRNTWIDMIEKLEYTEVRVDFTYTDNRWLTTFMSDVFEKDFELVALEPANKKVKIGE